MYWSSKGAFCTERLTVWHRLKTNSCVQPNTVWGTEKVSANSARGLLKCCATVTLTFFFFQFKFLQFKINLVQSAVIAKLESYAYFFLAWLHWSLNILLKPEEQQQKWLELQHNGTIRWTRSVLWLPLPIAPGAPPHCHPCLFDISMKRFKELNQLNSLYFGFVWLIFD